MDQFYELVMLYLVHYAHHMTFPELVYPWIGKCKKFSKTCKVQNFVKIIRGLLEKVQENVKLVEERRQKMGLNIRDQKQMVRLLLFPRRIRLHRFVSLCSNRINGWREAVINLRQVRWSFISNDTKRCGNEKCRRTSLTRRRLLHRTFFSPSSNSVFSDSSRSQRQVEVRCPI